MYLLKLLILQYLSLITELEITVGYQPFPTIFKDSAEQIQFTRTNLLQIFSEEANKSLRISYF